MTHSQSITRVTKLAARFGLALFTICLFAARPVAAVQSQQSFFDAAGRLTAVFDPATGSAQYSYDATGNILAIVRKLPTELTVLQITPSNGPVGTVVKISGSGFGTKTNTSVSFNGSVSAPSAVTATLITVTVPAAATTGPITVTAPSGSLTMPLPFNVGSPPVPSISGFSPTAVLNGTGLTISGGGFDLVNSKVFVNGLLAPVLSATTSILTSTVPAVSSGRIIVETPFGNATSANDLLIPPPGYSASAVAASTRVALGQTASLTVGTSSSIGLILFDGLSGQRVSAIVTSSSLTTGSLCLYSTYNVQLGSCSSTVQTAYLPPQSLRAIGTYSFAAIPATGVTGSISVALYDASDVLGTIVENGNFVGTTTAPGQNVRVTFTGAAGDRVALASALGGGLAGQYAYFQIIGPDGAVIYNSGLSFGTALSSEVLLSAAGTYTILYQPSSTTATGTVAFTLSQSVSGVTTIGSAGTPLTIAFAGQTARVTFSGAAGDHIALAAILAVGLTGQYGYYRISNPDGSTLYDSGLASGQALSGDLVLSATGSYAVTYRPYTTFNTGTVTFTVSRAVTGTTTIDTAGTPLTIALAGQTASATFSGAPGDRIALGAILAGGLTSQYGYFRITNPDATVLYDSGLSSGQALSGELLLPANGTYTITYRPYATFNTGTVTFTVSRTVARTTAVDSASLPITIALAGQTTRVTFAGATGDRIALGSLMAGGLAGQYGYFRITNPDTTVLYDSGLSSGQALSGELLLPATGTYTITYRPYTTFNTGTVTFTVSRTVAGTTAIDSAGLPITIALAGQTARVTFSGATGDRIALGSLLAGGLSGQYGYFRITNPDATVLYDSGLSSGQALSGELLLPTTGTYTITYRPYTTFNTGTVTFTVSRTVAGTTAIDSAGLPITIALAGQTSLVTFSGATGDRIALGSLLGGGLAGQYGYFRITNPDATVLYDSGLSSGQALSGELLLPANGTYTITYRPYTTFNTGTVTFTVSRTVAGTITIGGAGVPMTIALPAQTVRETFTASAGDRIAMASLMGGSLTGQYGYFKILNPDSSTLYDSGLSSGQALSGDLLLPATGSYIVTYRPYTTFNTGTVTFTVSNTLTAATSIGGAAIPLTTILPGQNIRVSFLGTAAQTANIAVAAGGFGGQCFSVKILKPDLSILNGGTSCSTYTTGTLTLPATGTYVMAFAPSGTATGTATTTVAP